MENKLLIIIPVFNCFEFLKESEKKNIYSDINKRNNIDMFFINDGSSDETENILKKYSKKYKNINFMSQKNSGATSARLAGLKYFENNSAYTHFMFIDGDDYILPNNLFKLWEYSNNASKNQIILGVWSGINKINWNSKGYCFAPSPTARILPRHLLGEVKIELPEFKYEDGPIFHVMNVKYNHNIAKYLLPIFVYNEENSNSITRQKDPSYLRDIFISLDWTLKRFKEENLSLEKCAFIFWEELINHQYRVFKAPSYNFVEEYKYSISNIYAKFDKKIIKTAFKQLSFKKKILVILLKMNFFRLVKVFFKYIANKETH